MLPKDTMLVKKKRPSGAQRRKLRKAQGLYTEKERLEKQASDRKRTRNIYGKRSALVDSIKLERGCTDCGYKGHPAALHFDHLPEYEKVDTIARMTGWSSLEALMAEIAKCEVVCANCHTIRTVERREAKRNGRS